MVIKEPKERKKNFFQKLVASLEETELDEKIEDQAAGEKVAQEMIQGILDLSQTFVKEAMVPRIDVQSLARSEESEQILKKIANSPYSRYPVYEGTVDNIVGILYAKDVFARLVRQGFEAMGASPFELRPAFFVPETKRLDVLLRDFQKNKMHMAIVIDEYGGFAGIVCLEDILEYIVGDIQDEFDNEKEEIQRLDSQTYLCQARVLIEDVNQTVGLDIPNEDYDTLGGFLFDLLGKIPQKGEKVVFANTEFEVYTLEGNKIKTIKVVRQA